MKKIYLSAIAISFSLAALAQSQRLVVFEQFTQASCPPCATANPPLNTMLNANSTKVVSIKYQTSWPGVDPMNAQNPTEVAERVSYYGVNGVPDGYLDGGLGFSGQPSSMTLTQINNRYAVPAGFDMTATHTFSPNYDMINVSVTITASQAMSGSYVAHVAVIERDIHFTTAPGSNGEKHFEGVMRKMLPDANGTTLSSSWTVGQTQTLTFSIPVPSYIYDLNTIGVVAFVQNASKGVEQGAYSAPIGGIPTTNDAGISAASGYSFLNCASSITPSVTVKNFATAPLTSCNINYQVDGGPVTTQPWTGSLAQNATAVVSLAALNLTGGVHTLKFYTSNPNNAVDYKPINNAKEATVDVVAFYYAAPLTEDFQSTQFPSNDWAINNFNNDATFTKMTGWGGFATGATASSIFLNFYNITAGKYDELYMPGLGLVGAASAQLTFDVAYCQYSSENDKLEVMISNNCGTSWTTLYNKSGAALSTRPATTSNFAPTAAEWRNEVVDLSNYVGQNVIIKLKATSAYGNNLWLDNINVTQVAGIADVTKGETLNVYPNPTSGLLQVDANITNNGDLKVSVSDVLGNVVYSNQFTQTANKFSIDLSNQANGMYFVKFENKNGVEIKKINVQK
ncbi:MAG: Omp28-related outer membrane protein [Bacteroidia bacterium]|nr:Omp28-related outer membrane protein [Bacteroidia bacterium]